MSNCKKIFGIIESLINYRETMKNILKENQDFPNGMMEKHEILKGLPKN